MLGTYPLYLLVMLYAFSRSPLVREREWKVERGEGKKKSKKKEKKRDGICRSRYFISLLSPHIYCIFSFLFLGGRITSFLDTRRIMCL
ncbi:hypothetical protein F4777DRAFT_568595, partial [Nemania sp. FL0916]